MWGFRIFRWHSINLVPHFTIYSVCSDNHPYDAVSRVIDLILFGIIIQVRLPSKKNKKFYSSPMVGPLWSRNRSRWYRFKDITRENYRE